MALMIFAGTVAVVFGALFLFFPQRLNRFSELANRSLAQLDPAIRSHRFGAGLCLFAVGIFCLVSAYYVWLRLH